MKLLVKRNSLGSVASLYRSTKEDLSYEGSAEIGGINFETGEEVGITISVVDETIKDNS